MKKSILLVCLGNICRSPLAHGIFEHLASKNGLDWKIDSAGTGDWHVGNTPDRRSIAEAAKHGIDLTTQRARQFEKADFDKFDHIYVMDDSNYSNVCQLARNAADIQKVELMIPDQEVPDPYFGGQDGFTQVYEMLETEIQKRIEALQI